MVTVEGVKSRGRDEFESVDRVVADEWWEGKMDKEDGAWADEIVTLVSSVYVRDDELIKSHHRRRRFDLLNGRRKKNYQIICFIIVINKYIRIKTEIFVCFDDKWENEEYPWKRNALVGEILNLNEKRIFVQ